MKRFFTLFKTEVKLQLGWAAIKTDWKQDTKGKVKILSIGLIIGIALAVLGWLYVALLKVMFGPASLVGMQSAILTMVILLAMILSFVMGVAQCAGLYFNKDTDFLFSLPMTQRTAFLGKFIPLLAVEALVDAAIILPALVVYSQYVSAGLLFWAKGVLVILLVSMIPLCLAAIIASLFMRITAVVRHKDKILMVLGIFFFAAYMAGTQFLGQAMSSVNMSSDAIVTFLSSGFIRTITTAFPPAGWAAESIIYSGSTGLGSLMLFTGVSLLAYGFTLFVAGNSFVRLSSNQTESLQSTKKVDINKESGKIRSSLSAFVSKEWKVVLRAPMIALNCFAMAIAGPIMIACILFIPRGDGSISEMLMALDLPVAIAGYIILGLAGFLYFIGCTNAGAATVYSREGKSLWLLKTLPMSPVQIAKAKLLFGMQIVLLCIVPSTLILTFLVQDFISPIYILLAGLLAILANLPVVAIGELFDMMRPNLTWTSETVVVKRSFSVFVQMVAAFLYLAANVFLCIGIGKAGGDATFMTVALLGGNIVLAAGTIFALFRMAPKLIRKMDDA